MTVTVQNQRIPKRLRRKPLIELIWQAAFEASSEPYPEAVLGGIIYAELRKTHDSWQLQRLPTTDIPSFITVKTLTSGTL